MMKTQRETGRTRLNMYEPAIFVIRIQGEIGRHWQEYFCAQTARIEVDKAGYPVTVLTTEPVDQAGLIGIINQVNMLGLPLVSAAWLSTEP